MVSLSLAGALGCAFALMLVLEGLLPFINPSAWRRVFEQALGLSDAQLRGFGLGSMLVGLILLVLVLA